MIGREDFSTAMDDCVTRWPSLKGQLEVYYKSLNSLTLRAFSDICEKFVEGSRSMPLPRDFKEEYEIWRQGNRIADVDGATYRIRTGVTCKTCMKEN